MSIIGKCKIHHFTWTCSIEVPDLFTTSSSSDERTHHQTQRCQGKIVSCHLVKNWLLSSANHSTFLHSVKPVLKKVNKTESKLARFDKKGNSLASFRTQLKSTGQHKFALDEKEEVSCLRFSNWNLSSPSPPHPQQSKNPDWRDHLGKTKSEKDGDEELEEGGANGETGAEVEIAE